MTKLEYDAIFMEEWSYIFPRGFSYAINELWDKYWSKQPKKNLDVISNAIKTMENYVISQMMIEKMSRCWNPEYMSERERVMRDWNRIIYG